MIFFELSVAAYKGAAVAHADVHLHAAAAVVVVEGVAVDALSGRLGAQSGVVENLRLVEVLQAALADGHLLESYVRRLDEPVGYIGVDAVGHGVGYGAEARPLSASARVDVHVDCVGAGEELVPVAHRYHGRLAFEHESPGVLVAPEVRHVCVGPVEHAEGQRSYVAGYLKRRVVRLQRRRAVRFAVSGRNARAACGRQDGGCGQKYVYDRGLHVVLMFLTKK